MSLAQLHYTSAAPGDEGTVGRFTAVGPGIPTALLPEIEPLLGYEPPRDVPFLPTDTELRSMPQVFSYTHLSDGSRLLSRAVPLAPPGAGSGTLRFHTHAVLLPAGARLPGDRLPITAWRSPRWVSVTPSGAIPDPLTSPHAGPGLEREALGDFAVSRGPWLAAVFADLRRVRLESASGAAARVALVERQSEDVARWIGLASSVLPPDHAERLTFTTYSRRPSLAPQQVVGVLPEDAHLLDAAEIRMHLCGGPHGRPSPPSGDAWAETAARVWRSRAPELFDQARALHGEPFAAGPLAVTALCAGIALGPDERSTAADWAAERPYTLDEDRTRKLVDALTASTIDDRSNGEFDAVGRLFSALDGRAPVTTTAPLAAMLVTEAVRGGNGSLELPDRSAFTGPEGKAIAETLAPEILDELGGSGAALDIARTVQLLRVARLLDIDCTELLPSLVDRVAPALPAAPGFAWGPALLELLDEQFDVRTALLVALDRIAPDDPAAMERLLGRVPLPFTGTQSLPHLRMCAESRAIRASCGEDRAAALSRVLRTAGISPFAEPLVLRSAVGLVWSDREPTAGEARMLLEATTSDAHRSAGTWSHLVGAALGAAPHDADAADLAHDLLRGFPHQILGRERGALLLLDFARAMRPTGADTETDGTKAPDGAAPGEGWAERVLALRPAAEPVEPDVLEHALGALARRLLAPERPEAELYAFVHTDDPDLLAAYGRAAREEPVLARLRSDPAFAADCYLNWSAHPHAGAHWARTSTALLDEVLRPAVRELSSAGVLAVEEAVGRAGSSGRTDAFRAWNRRPAGTLGRFGRRLAGKVRRP
ncbi:GTPase-associated protein 1-related protein [Streptomyces sp. NBC_00102]|uniref:GTPase-associated protein 1-related protein n=1 Tax=Streptomyces sp. NBC_00102 TaxID=2975652 RepID=UPI002259E435|nr:GTPase-associated protein 1-related protein [Streptomyces sp. NBC_00102]MCX5400562.1 GTPase-associated protein 1-related protein [Streptomyces sp. NBC_00102]